METPCGFKSRLQHHTNHHALISTYRYADYIGIENLSVSLDVNLEILMGGTITGSLMSSEREPPKTQNTNI